MIVQQSIEQKLRSSLEPVHLQVVNESHMHSVPPGSESHFKVVIVSDRFEGQPLVQRHQAVNKVLEQELRGAVHALSIQTMTANEWERRGGQVLASPACHGGGKKDR